MPLLLTILARSIFYPGLLRLDHMYVDDMMMRVIVYG